MQPDKNLDLAQRFVRLPLEQRRLFFQKLVSKNIGLSQLPIPVTRHEVAALPLSYAQQRQWFLWQMAPQSAAYHIPAVLRLRGRLDLGALWRSFETLIARHDTLRTRFRQEQDQAVQLVDAELPFELPCETLVGCGEEALQAHIEAEIQALFDLQRGPLLRVKLLRLAADEHVLVLTLHHIIADGWSMARMVDELVQLYAAYSEGREANLAELPIQYADYALWQRCCMEAGERERQLAYWREQLGGEQLPLELPSDRSRPAEQSYRGGEVDIPLPDELAHKLRELAQRRGVTLFMLLLASFQSLLNRHSGQADIRVGVPIANRTRVETEGLVGFFVNTQVLKAEFALHTTFDDLLAQVKQRSLEAQAYQELPFEQLVEALQPERDLSHSPLFQVMYNHQSESRGQARELPGLSVESLPREARTAQFDLTLDTFESERGLRASLTYASDLFERSTVERLADHWRNLLEAVCADPQRRIAELPILGAAERHQVLHEWNDTAAPYRQACLHELFEEQVARTPEALALIDGEHEYSYRELNQRANRLAHKLRELGVGPEALVGIAMQRRLELLVALLATLKAGGAYVPLDPEYPQERQAYMLEDSQARLLLTQRALLAQLPQGGTAQVLAVDDLALEAYSQDDPRHLASPENLAYCIYTSGSTGKPKGVLIEHRNAAALVGWARSVYSREDLQGVLASTSICFDLSVWEFFVTLACGGFVVLADNALALPELPARQRVRLVNTVPSAIRMLCEAGQIPDSVRIVNLAGEPLAQAVVDNLYGLGHIERVYDLYGPSEDTTYSTYTLRAPGGSANIGRPLANSGVHLIDASGEPAGIGKGGELCMVGAGLARGYLNRPALTAEKFLPDPFAAQGGGRLYRTGDLARYRPDGVIEYLGRIDHQVKIRGFRIELGEIEARLLEQDAVREAVVLARDGASGKQLVGYVVPAAGVAAGDPRELREALRTALKTNLPDYMVPAQLLFLEALPLTPNGKLDRKALPQPDANELQQDYVAPRSELERQLAAIWQEVLKRPQVGATDNFFELGGDSIVSLQVVSRARQAGIQFTPKDLFQHQTVQGLASVARRAEGLRVEQGAVSGGLPLTPIQQWFFGQDIPTRQHWNQSLLLAPRQPLQIEPLKAALQALLAHHDALRLRFERHDGAWRAEFSAPQQDAEVLWSRRLATPEALEDVANQAQRSLDLQQGPLLRVVLAELPGGEQRLLLVIHHLVVDGVSWRVLLDDLQQAYARAVAGQPAELPAKTSSFKAWAERLAAHAQGAAAAAELAYWQAQLAGVSDALPCANPAGGRQQKHVAYASTRLDRDWTRRLLQEAPAAYRTQVNDLLLTALARVICRWSGQAQTLVRLEGHGREELFEDIDLTRTVGWFTSMYPVRLSPRAGLADSIKTIKEQLRAVPGKGLSYGLLRHLGSDEARRALESLPSGAIVFNYLGQFDQSFDAEDGLFVPAKESSGAGLDENAPLDGLLNLNGRVYDGELSLDWGFSREVFDERTIQRLASEYADELRELIGHCCAAANRGLTPSDVPLARLSQEQLDSLPLPAAQIADIYPLSPMQQGMLFHSLYEREGGDYVNQMRVDVEGLEVEGFRRAWQAAVDAHDVLRAAFISELAQPLQVIRRQMPVPFAVLDWQGQADLGARLDAWANADRERGFDLTEEPLLRLTVIRTGERSHHLIYTCHHILLDGWSNSRLLGEVLQRYAGQPVGRAAGGYRDYIAWLQRQDPQASEAFWKTQLVELDAPTRLTHALRPALAGQAGHGLYSQVLDEQRTRQLGEFARSLRVTLNTLLQAAWLLLLRRYTGQDTVCFGATVAGRPAELAGIEEQVGLFINTQPVIGSPRAEQTAAEWIAQVQARSLALREFEHTPLYEVQRWARLGNEALFDSLLVFENYPVSEALQQGAPAGLRFGEVGNHEQTNYPLALAVLLGERLEVHYSYDRRHFDEETLGQVAGHFGNLLVALCENPQARLAELEMLGEAERAQILQRWDHTADHYPSDRYIHQLVADRAAETPDAVAVIFADQPLTYGELDTRANRLAHRLIELGVGPEVRVAIAMRRSAETMVAFLAVLKAGGAYVPLDVAYPRERLLYMMQDCAAALVLTQSDLEGQLPLPEGLPTLAVDRAEEWQSLPATAPTVALHGDNLAYVIYTSGSTGLPKGVAVSHGPLVSHIRATGERYETNPSDCELHFMSFAFDGAHEGWMHPLINGARVLIRDDSLWLPEQTYAQMHRHQVTLAVFPPVYLQQLAEHAERDGNPPPTRVYCFGGDAVPQASYDLAWRALRPQYLFNGYGPTETVVTPLLWKARKEDPCGAAYAPIGTLLGKRRGYVLDAELNLLPVGLAGELYLGGEGVARGYLERPALTAERFVPDPFGNGERVYRSGDLTRARPDGVVDYLGRVDHQVKIRGFRIELGEIEARLLEQDAVREAVVLARDGASGKQLVGYVVPTDELAAEQRHALRDELKAALKGSLPEYMVPTQLLFLETLPLTPNGKLDRKALPQPDISELQQDYVAPRSELERQLADIWQEVLKLPQVGLNDNFFELGGDSIISLQLVSRARQAGIRFTPKELFQHQTVQELARVARRTEEAAVDQGPASGTLPLTPIQRWFFEQDIPQRHHWNQSVLLAAPGKAWDGEVLERALRELVIHHDALRLAFDAGSARYRDLAEVQSAWEQAGILWQAELDGPEALEALGEEAQRSLNLAGGPLLRALLATLADGSQRLLLVIHHLVVDGVSWRILLEDLESAYRQLAAGQPPRLPARTSSLQAWASRLLEHAGSSTLRQELDYWRNELQGADPTLPCDNPEGSRRQCDAQHVQLRLDADMTRNLLQVAPAAYRTQVNDLLLTALARAVCRWSSRDHALIQLEGHGREDLFEGIDLSRTVGWFTSVYPLRLVPEQDPGRSLMGIKEQLRAVPGKGIGFGLLRYLGDAASQQALRALPEPRITFNYLGQFDGPGAGDGEPGHSFSTERAGADLSEQAPLGNWLSINGQVYDGELSLTWTFSREVFQGEGIERLAEDYRRELEGLIEHCCQPGRGALTPADVPLAGLTQEQLDALGLEAARVEDIYPLTPIQRGMLPEAVHEQGDFICQHTLGVRGLDPERFRRAWQATLDAHGMLRTGFVAATAQRQPLQVVYRSVEAPFTLVDGRGLTPLEVEERLLEDRLTPFDMAKAPLLRLTLVRLADDEYRVALTSHHILLDGWSASLLYEDILRAYLTGAPAPVAGSFRDYLAWLQGVDHEGDRRFWQQALTRLDAPSLLAPAASGGACGHGHLFFALTPERSAALGEFARQQRVTVNTLVQAAWLLLLGRRLQRTTVACGVTLSGRPAELPGIERQLGLYINDVPLVAEIAPELSIAQWLQALQVFNLRMREHGYASLAELQQWHGSELFDTVIVFENYPGEMSQAEEGSQALQFLGMGHHEQTSTPLTLYVELDKVWGFHFDYRLDRFQAAVVESLGAELQRLLAWLVEAAPSMRLGELEGEIA